MRDAAGTAGVAVGLASTKCTGAVSSGKDEKNILNYNPEMEYRRLGKTELMVSAVCLGGHWKRVNVMDQDFDRNRWMLENRNVNCRCWH